MLVLKFTYLLIRKWNLVLSVDTDSLSYADNTADKQKILEVSPTSRLAGDF